MRIINPCLLTTKRYVQSNFTDIMLAYCLSAIAGYNEKIIQDSLKSKKSKYETIKKRNKKTN
jgi:hypothetical protein